VVTVSDRVSGGSRGDASGPAVAQVLEREGFRVLETRVVPDHQSDIEAALRDLAGSARLVVTTGGTGLGVRDVTPEATTAVIERVVPGLAEAMRAAGRPSTPTADLSRGVVGVLGTTMVVNLPGNPNGAVESLRAILPALPHALAELAGAPVHDGSHTRRAP
jgi:molybdenum cofactor synthesis domain-containing protein